jgi:hypothetical protein
MLIKLPSRWQEKFVKFFTYSSSLILTIIPMTVRNCFCYNYLMRDDSYSKPPTHRVVIDRRTGRPAGPIVPIHPDDWPYGKLPGSETLWRYMDFFKFEDLLTRSALYFSRPDKFTDPFEGRFSPGNATNVSASDAAFYSAYRMESFNKQLTASQEIMRHVIFISCWQRGNKEDREMWNAYTSSSESVVISTSVKALDQFVKGPIEKSPVKYHADNSPRTEFDHTALFFYKPDRYRFEREFRMLLTPGGHEPIPGDKIGWHVPIRLKKIIHRVIVHPKASKEFKTKIDHLMMYHIPGIKFENSTLLP